MNGTWKKGPGTELFAALEKVSSSSVHQTVQCLSRACRCRQSAGFLLAVLQHCLCRGIRSWVPCGALLV